MVSGAPPRAPPTTQLLHRCVHPAAGPFMLHTFAPCVPPKGRPCGAEIFPHCASQASCPPSWSASPSGPPALPLGKGSGSPQHMGGGRRQWGQVGGPRVPSLWTMVVPERPRAPGCPPPQSVTQRPSGSPPGVPAPAQGPASWPVGRPGQAGALRLHLSMFGSRYSLGSTTCFLLSTTSLQLTFYFERTIDLHDVIRNYIKRCNVPFAHCSPKLPITGGC